MENLNKLFITFVQTIKPRPLMGELQCLAAFCRYLETQDESTIPGSGIEPANKPAKRKPYEKRKSKLEAAYDAAEESTEES